MEQTTFYRFETPLSSPFPPRRGEGDVRPGRSWQEERTAQEEERDKEEGEGGETCQSKETQEDCKWATSCIMLL